MLRFIFSFFFCKVKGLKLTFSVTFFFFTQISSMKFDIQNWRFANFGHNVARTPREMTILDNSGISWFFKRGGYPLPVNSGDVEALIFDADTSRGKMTQNHQKTRRVWCKIVWHERNGCHAFLHHPEKSTTQLFSRCHTILKHFGSWKRILLFQFYLWNL